MKKYTQAEFAVDCYGYKRCPTGDYTAISNFGERCIFDERCDFGECCNFGEHCRFGTGCRFGRDCYFGADCRFGITCRFGERCNFGKGGRFCKGNIFGVDCLAESPSWPYVYEPPFETTGRILPTENTREYWESRLGMKLKGCYKEIEEQLKPLLPEILGRIDLTKYERRILESWRGENK